MKGAAVRMMLAVWTAAIPGGTQAQEVSTPDADAKPAATSAPATQADLEKKFEETMTGAVLVGSYSARGEQAPREDRYTIVSARKLMGDRWLIMAGMKYRNQTAAIPIVVPVKWAGDTPVISVTDLTIPGLGSYTARVMIFKDQYAGMWEAGERGGLMWGRIERAAATAPKDAPESKPESPK
jgi:hypothetical protein